ncbi:MAG: ABC transporter permease [Thermonemataceae bacterium]
MWKSYFKIGLRNIQRNRVTSFINIGGLAISFLVVIIIGLWLWDKLSYNTYHKNYDRIAQVMHHSKGSEGEIYTNQSLVSALGDHLQTTFASHFAQVATAVPAEQTLSLEEENKGFMEKGVFISASAPEMFTLEMLQGSRNGLQGVNQILLSASLATKIFGEQNPVNQTVKIGEQQLMTVKGVYKDLPSNTTFEEIAYMISLDTYFSEREKTWDNYFVSIYVQLQPEVNLAEVNQLIKGELAKNIDEVSAAKKPVLFLQPMSDWYLFSHFENGKKATSKRLQYVRIASIIGIFILVLACINFTNLSTARASERAKEIGIRKTVGAQRNRLIKQFLVESIMITAAAFTIALLFTIVLLPLFNQAAQEEVQLRWDHPLFWLLSLSVVLFTGLLAGIYPALYLSAFQTVKILKGSFQAGRTTVLFRKVLVVFQFSISMILLVGTIVIFQQINFTKNRSVGYEQEKLLTMINAYDRIDLLSERLKATGLVEAVGQANYPLTNTLGNNDSFTWEGKPDGFDPSFNTVKVSEEYGQAVNWKLLKGRNFSRDFKTDTAGIIINETAAKLLGFDNPIGQQVRNTYPGWNEAYFGGRQFTIVGVIEDMIKGSPFEPATPLMLFYEDNPHHLYWLFVKIKPQHSFQQALPAIEAVFNQLYPAIPFNYKLVEDEYATKFRAEESMASLVSSFASLAILISCLGLFGLTTFTIAQRTKEIAIRKVLGASILNLWQMLSRDYLRLVLWAGLISLPLAYLSMESWLEGYYYRIQLSWQVFAATIFAVTLLTLLTVSFKSIKAALMNPANTLKDE